LTSVNGHGQRVTGCWGQGYRSIGGWRWRSCRATTSQPGLRACRQIDPNASQVTEAAVFLNPTGPCKRFNI